VAVHPDAPAGPAPNPEAELSLALHPAHQAAHQIQDALQNQDVHPCPDDPDHPAQPRLYAWDASDGVRLVAAEDETPAQTLLRPLADADVQKLLSPKQIRQDEPDPSLHRFPNSQRAQQKEVAASARYKPDAARSAASPLSAPEQEPPAQQQRALPPLLEPASAQQQQPQSEAQARQSVALAEAAEPRTV
jgi:hypothetical protein